MEVDYKFISNEGITVDTEYEIVHNIHPEEMVEVRFVTYQDFDKVAIKSGLSNEGWFTIYDVNMKDEVHENGYNKETDPKFTTQYIEGVGYYIYYEGTIAEFKSRVLGGSIEEMEMIFGIANMSKVHPEYEYTLVGKKKNVIFKYKDGIPVVDNLNK